MAKDELINFEDLTGVGNEMPLPQCGQVTAKLTDMVYGNVSLL